MQTDFYRIDLTGNRDIKGHGRSYDSVVIKAAHEPTAAEAADFCHEYISRLGYSGVGRVSRMTEEEADRYFDTSDSGYWPVLE